MITVMVTALLVLGTAFAAGTILHTLRHYRGTLAALRGMLAECRDEREVRVTVCEWNVSETARVLRPDFTRLRKAQSAGRGLLAAA